MTEERPLKRSEILAIENVKRIADQLRSERNDALALAQLRREQLEKSKALLVEARDSLASGAPSEDLVQRIEGHLASLEEA